MQIYKIVNKLNGCVYIGQTTVSIHKRWVRHRYEHKRGARNIYRLYDAFLKFGIENFFIEPICGATTKIELDELEKHYITQYKSTDLNFGYNESGGRRGEGVVSEKTKKKISKANTGKIDLHSLKNWKIIYPDGKITIITNLDKFCRENNLKASHMRTVAKGNRKHHKGYSCVCLGKTYPSTELNGN